mmetsp:Transcript_63538/g.182451  ORF Transcript_63538/g.182451 Transcript_63538/m.182451 type:complete len:846 (-) Transcript_63538:23-2560(-)
MGDDDEKLLKWTFDVPEPEVSLDLEDGIYRAELICYVSKGGRVKDVRVRGPGRGSRKEARKDAKELKKAAFKGGSDPALFQVRARRKELESVKWNAKDLEGIEPDEDKKEDARRKEIEARMNEKNKTEVPMQSHGEVLARLAAGGGPSEAHKAVGPNWKRPGSMTMVPNIAGQPDNSWLIHEKQEATGKYRAWLFFNSATGKYYRQKEVGGGYLLVGVPNAPQEYPLYVRVGSANLPSKTGKKLDMAVLLPELHKTGFLLKQPLEFMDKPASLFVLCDGLRNSPAAAEFCAKKMHSLLLPKLSARATAWEDFELADLLRETVEGLDALLLASPACFAGCSLAVGLLSGTRIVLGGLGGVRCLICRPPPATPMGGAPQRKAVQAQAPWTSQLVVGGDAHTIACQDELLRIESVGCRLADGAPGNRRLSSVSARPAELQAIANEKERLLVQIARASNPFATLGLGSNDLKDGKTSIRKVFRKLSLVVHPDKVGEELKARAMGAFSKLDAAASAIESMLGIDQAAAELLAQIDAAVDGGRLAADPAIAAKLIGVLEGCGPKQTKQAVEKKFHAPLARLQNACPKDVERALQALKLAEDTVVRGTVLWTPAEADEAVQVTRAMGCKDLKSPTPLLSASLVAECVELEPGVCVGVAMLPDGMSAVTNEEVAQQLARHSPARPRAAALRLALQGASRQDGSAIGAVCAYLDFESMPAAGASAKRLKSSKPERVRISHILLRWAGQKGEDEFAKPGVPPPQRTQAMAELELLELCEELIGQDPKTLGARFKAQVMKCSECASALNVPYADLGWIELGGAEAPLEAAAFATPVGGVSDVVVSSRGAHLMYRLA